MDWDLRDVCPGLWIWRTKHPDWSPEADWEPLVCSTDTRAGVPSRVTSTRSVTVPCSLLRRAIKGYRGAGLRR